MAKRWLTYTVAFCIVALACSGIAYGKKRGHKDLIASSPMAKIDVATSF